ncbi:tRNA (guanine-N(7)-)-methyltransferase (tRNA(m7G46)-methyltransferase) [Rhizina undulata]
MKRRDILLLSSLSALVLLNIAAKWVHYLRLIIWAFFTGSFLTIFLFLAVVLLSAHRPKTYFMRSGDDGADDALRNIRPLAFTTPSVWSSEVSLMCSEDSFRRSPLYPPSFVISDSIDKVLDYILRDFINSWYSKVSQDPSFSIQVDKTIRHALEQLLDRLHKVNMVEFVVGNIVPLLTAHLNDFSSAERTVRGKHLNNNLTESEELHLAIAAKYREGKLHPAASLGFSDMKIVQQDYLRKRLEKILSSVLPERERKSRAVGSLVREIVSCAILFPVLGMLSDPDFWNQLVEAIGGAVLQDRKTLRKLRAALDQHATPMSRNNPQFSKQQNPNIPLAPPFKRLLPNDDERTFERFIRSIRLCNNLSDARRLRNEIMAQLKRDERMEGREGWAVYIKRLEQGRKVVEQKVAHLSAGGSGAGAMPPRTQVASSRLESASLEEMLRDSSGLSYFMEYMDRQRRLPLVQFWLVVDGLRNPLEDDISSSDEEQEGTSSTSLSPWTPSDRNDLAQIHDAYLSSPELQISEKSRRAVRDFLKAGNQGTQREYIKARAAILRAQTFVYEEMRKKDFSGFKGTDLYFKYLASDETAAAQGGPTSRRSSKDMQRSLSWTETASPLEPPDSMISSRGSFDSKNRPEALLEDWDFDPLSASRQSLNEDPFSPRQQHPEFIRRMPESRIVEAVEAALNDIIEDRPNGLEESTSSLTQNSPDYLGPDSPRSSIDVPRNGNSGTGSDTNTKPEINEPVKQKARVKPPSIASLGLVNAYTRDTVFSEDDLFPEENAGADELYSDEDSELEDNKAKGDSGEIHQAAPGDLGLAEAIAALSFDIEKLSTQEAVVDSLYRKAELTNNTVELRILRKSKASLQREIKRKELQRQQYIIQESDNSLYGRSTIRIQSTMVGNENGQDFALYIIEVQRKSGEHMPAAQWALARRYSEFFQLHQQLRSKFPSVRQLDFPRKRVVMKLQKDFVEKRKVALEKYLKSLLLIPDVCRSRELRVFLSQRSVAPKSLSQSNINEDRRDIISRIYNSITDGMEDVLGNLPMLDQLSASNSNMLTTAGIQSQRPGSFASASSLNEISDVAEAEAELSAFEDKEVPPFVKPICDLFLEVFELNRKKNWLRGRAVVVVLHQLLGGTIERKIRDQAKAIADEESILKYISLVRDSLWPDGNMRQNPKLRTVKEKSRTSTEANRILAILIPDIAASVVGRDNAQSAGRRLFAAFNNERLNTSIIYTIFDELISALFDDSNNP